MKVCQKCGNQDKDNVKVCSRCKSEYGINKAQANNNQHDKQGQPPQNKLYSKQTQSKTIIKLKELATAPLFLRANIVFSVLVLVSIILAVLSTTTITETLEGSAKIQEMFSASEIAGMVKRLNAIMPIYQILSIIPMILISIGMWMFYNSSKDSNSGSTAGLTIIKGSVIFNLIKLLLIPVFLIIMLSIQKSNSIADVSNSGIGNLVIIIILIMSAIFLVLPVLYYVSIIKTINEVKKTIITQVPSNKVSGFLGVMNYILAAFLVISSIGSEGIIASLLKATFLIMITIGLSTYKREMEILMSSSKNTYK